MLCKNRKIKNALQKWRAIKCLEVMLTLLNALQKWRDIKCFEVMVTFINALQKWEENESTQRCFVTNVNGVTFT